MPDVQAVAPEKTIESGKKDESLLDKILTEGRLAPTSEERDRAKDWVQAFVEQIDDKKMAVSKDTYSMLDERIAALDQAITKQLNEVMHAEEFQRLEASWRGLRYLVFQSKTSPKLKIRVMHATKNDLISDFRGASEFDQSGIFKKVHDTGYGVLGGEPYGMLVGDYEFGRGPQDVELLEQISNVSAAAHAPFISAVNPKMFNWESFTELTKPRALADAFEGDAYIKWRSFRASDDSRYVGLTLPHVLMRLPYGKETEPVKAFDFEEDVSEHRKYLWGNAAYAFASRVTDAFDRYEWCAAIRGVEGGGLVEGLPIHTFETEKGEIAPKVPTEIAIPDRREAELSNLGFIPLCWYMRTDGAAFIGAQSAQKPAVYLDDDANANARLSAQLPYIFAVSRFAHFLKAMMRDKIGRFMERSECEIFLNNWISHFVLDQDNATQEQKAATPLRAARIVVEEIKGKPGAYNAVAYLRPHFQLDELRVSLRLVARLPESLGK